MSRSSGAQEPQPGGTNGHNSVSTGGGDDQPVTSHTVPTYHQEDANTEKSDGLQADDMSDDDSESDSGGTVIEDEDNFDDEPVILEGALNASEVEVEGVKQIASNDDDEIGNEEVLKLSQQASALTPIRQNNFVQNNYWELVPSAAKKMNWKPQNLIGGVKGIPFSKVRIATMLSQCWKPSMKWTTIS